jgi:hypothetical protein
VVVPLSSLPSDPSDLIDLLKLELAHPDLWLCIALHYYAQQRHSEFTHILGVVTGAEASEAYGSDVFKSSRIRIYNTLASYHLSEGNRAAEGTAREAQYSQAINYLNRSTELDIHVPDTWCAKGKEK